MKSLLIALVCCSAFAAAANADAPTNHEVAVAMTKAADKIFNSFSDEQRAKAMRRYMDPVRTDWHNIPKDERKGLQFKDMNGMQRELCRELLKTALSDVGFEKAERIMSLENNLLVGEKGKGPLRDPERYFLTIFGKPTEQGPWGWSFEGHHLSLNFVVHDGKVTAETPSFWGANPATVGVFVEGGPKVGTRTLADEEQLAFDIINSMTDSQKKLAIIAEKAPDDYRNAGVPTPPAYQPEGLAVSQMSHEQMVTLRKLLETYSAHLEKPLADEQFQAIEKADLDKVYFAWAGATEAGKGHYYRIQGPTFVLELCNIQTDPQGNEANHIHSVWRNVKGDFDLPVTAK